MRRKFRSGVGLPQRDEVADGLEQANRVASQGRVDEAIGRLSALLERHPRRTEILVCMTRVLVGANRLADAADVLNALKQHLPNRPEVRSMLGTVLFRMRRFPAAEPELLEAIRLDPVDVQSRIQLAQVYEQWGRDEDASTTITEAVRQEPLDVGLTLTALGVLRHAGRDLEARALLDEAPESVSSQPEVRFFEAGLMPIIPRSVEEIDERRAHFSAVLEELRGEGRPFRHPEGALRHSNFHLGYHGREDRGLIEQVAGTLLELVPGLGYTSPKLEREPVSRRRIVVGFSSAHMRVHSVGRVLNRFLKELDRRRFEVLLFEQPGKYNGGQEIARGFADRTILVPGELEAARKTIEAENPDILVIPDFVLDPFSESLAYSRLAPVQCATWGHPGTSGRPSIDYWVSCEDWEPPGNERLYTERLVRLSKPPMIATRLDVPASIESRSSLGLPEGTLYGCPQSLYKLHPEFDSYLGDILRKDPNGWLILIGGIQPRWIETFRHRFEASYRDVADRLVFLKFLSTDRYLSVLSHCAVSLDPIHFGGANTSMEAFTMGLPVVTLPGTQLRNRQTLSFYRMMEFEPLVVSSREQYIETAVRLGTDPAFRDEMSREVRDRCHVLFDTVDVTRELEQFFEDAARQAIGG